MHHALDTEVRFDEPPPQTTTRRAPPREISVGAPSQRDPRDRASFVPPTDSDWDTPAFQRRGHS
jgi:cell division protein FtsZ